MTEQGKDRYGCEYVRKDNDFLFKWLGQDNCVCSICHGTGAKVEFRYITRDYASAKTGKICQTLQEHEHSFWICPKCIKNLNTRKSIIHEENLMEPIPCLYCGGVAIRKQLDFVPAENEDMWKNEHHEDGSLKWSYLECNKCGRKTSAYCYEHQSTELWNQGKTELPVKEIDDERS